LPSEFTSRLLHGEIVREPDASWATHDERLFEQWRVDLEVPSADTNRIVLLELEARIRRLARSRCISSDKNAAQDLTPAMRDRSFEKVEQMAIYITENYQKSITATDIAAAAGLHPKYAMTLFRDRCGLTIGEYLAQQRISQAQRLLAATDKKIVDVAFSSGFGSVSQFYDVFTRHCHQSPKDFRRRQKQYYRADGGKSVLGD
jgi:AraC-like DNA-binding protein